MGSDDLKTVGVRFRRAGKVYTFEAPEAECSSGDRIIVETERGLALGKVVTGPRELTGTPPQPLKKVLRLAGPEEIAREEENVRIEKDAFRHCQTLIREKELPMKLLTVESLFDRSKMIFYFASEGRVDFRELVRDLARLFHTRIEMRQVGVRDEAKIIGGVGCCGKELCCAQWLTDFAPISVRMAKSQNIALNPAKISGICGRLLCCLSYEHQMYEDLSRGMPKVGKKVMTQKGEGKVIRRNALDGNFVIYGEHGETEVDLEQYKKFKLSQGGVPGADDSGDDHDEGEETEAGKVQPAPAPPAPAPRAETQPRREPSRQPERGEPQKTQNPPAEEGAEPESAAAPPGGHGKGKRRRRRRRPPGARENKND
ncbi:hypothetical protein EPN96_00745 [bacterium]|nr:MAG: hypothetical protein EPN96_00745 [bacterium]